MTTTDKSIPNHKFQSDKVILVSFAHLVHDIFSSFLSPLLPLLISKFGFSYSVSGLLTFAQRIPSLLNPLWGLIADKLPIKYLLIFAPALTTISMSLIGVVPNVFWLIVILLLTGFGASMFHIPAPVVIKSVAGNKIGRGMSFFMLGGEIARSLGPLMILSAVSWWGLEYSYRLMPIGLFASAILFIKFRKFELANEVAKRNIDNGAKQAFNEALPSFLTVMGIVSFNSLTKSAFSAFLPTLLTSQGESLWSGGISLVIFQIAGALGTISSGTLSDRFGRKHTLMTVAILIPALVISFLYSPVYLRIVFLFLLGFTLFFATPITMAEINDLKSGRPAFINSIYMSINFLVSAVNVIIVGVLSDFLGMKNTFLFCGVISFGSLFFIRKLTSIKNKEQ